VEFRDCDLTETDFSGATLIGVTFPGSSLRRARFNKVTARKLDLRGARELDIADGWEACAEASSTRLSPTWREVAGGHVHRRAPPWFGARCAEKDLRTLCRTPILFKALRNVHHQVAKSPTPSPAGAPKPDRSYRQPTPVSTHFLNAAAKVS
jgi:hypothetical protein